MVERRNDLHDGTGSLGRLGFCCFVSGLLQQGLTSVSGVPMDLLLLFSFPFSRGLACPLMRCCIGLEEGLTLD